ncbi:MAG: dehydrogenase [Phycisphaerae bacterium]|nr:dehydrogenase [Phycisphaerae bacterium]
MEDTPRSPGRRRVLTAGAATALATIMPLPSARAGRDGINRSTGRPLRFGVFGYGIRSRNLLDRFMQQPGIRLVGIAEIEPDRLAAGMKRVGGDSRGMLCRGYDDGMTMLEEADLDAVMIGTPDHWHAVPAIESCRRGIHVYCEKPLSRTIVEGRGIADAARESGVVFQVGSQQRSEFGRHFARAAELVRDGAIGDVEKVRIGVGDPPVPCELPEEPLPGSMSPEAWDRWLGPASKRAFHSDLCPIGVHDRYPAWRKYREFAGGGLADMGAHHFDIAQWALRRDDTGPTRVLPPDDPEALRGLRLIYADGVEMIHEGSVDCRFEGTDGWIEAGRGYLRASDPLLLEATVSDGAGLPRPADHITDWVEAIREGRGTIAPAEAGHRTATLCQLAAIGYELRKPLTWNPDREWFEGDHAPAANDRRSRPGRIEWTGHGS